MELIITKTELKKRLGRAGNIQSIGFVPTMGALHKGHLSLIEQAGKENEIVVVSIFVNPTQFNDKTDLEKYPRTLETDLQKLKGTPCDYVFYPDVDEMYPEPDTRKFDFGQLEKVLDGRYRPGHFNGVAQIVSKFFEIIKPDKAYFGLKDFQQFVIIKALVNQLNLNIEIVPCPIIREADGLAMSSRNTRLSPGQRANAAVIPKTLFEAKNLTSRYNVQQLEEWVIKTINKNPELNVEYFKIVDDERLQPVNDWAEPVRKVGCIAIHCGGVRLIDNVIFN